MMDIHFATEGNIPVLTKRSAKELDHVIVRAVSPIRPWQRPDLCITGFGGRLWILACRPARSSKTADEITEGDQLLVDRQESTP